ncbi:hypothetical protein AMTRI_Chr13g86670 [Amborella trichopoda]
MGLLKEKMEVTDRRAREILEIEDLASIENNPFIMPLLRLLFGPPSIMDFAEVILKELRTDLLLQHFKIQGLLIMARKAKEDPSSHLLDHGEYPPLVRNIAYLSVAVLKDMIKKVQQDFYGLNHWKKYSLTYPPLMSLYFCCKYSYP